MNGIPREGDERRSLGGKVFTLLREEILNGDFEENEELKENVLANKLGVSRTPVREALRQLELEGLVSIVPNKGAYVTGIGAEDVRDIYEMRAYLEGLCARWAAERITAARLDEMDENVYLSEFHTRRGHFDQLAELDSRFHELLYEACGSKMMANTLLDFHSYITRFRRRALLSEKRSHAYNIEHRDIFEAIKARDAEKAEELARLHMKNALQNLLDNGLFI